jgi:hypothetical protein
LENDSEMNIETPGTSEDDRAYFRAIETEFVRRRGTPFLLSPQDFALMREWRALGIPLESVLAGIEDVFARREERGAVGRINSLSYCRDGVLAAWERRAASSVGRGETRRHDQPLDVARALASLGEKLASAADSRPTLAEALERASASVARLGQRGGPAERVEQSLHRIEKSLLEAAAEALPEAERGALEESIDRRLEEARGRRDAEFDPRTRRVLLRRALRERFDLPPLTLLGDA